MKKSSFQCRYFFKCVTVDPIYKTSWQINYPHRPSSWVSGDPSRGLCHCFCRNKHIITNQGTGRRAIEITSPRLLRRLSIVPPGYSSHPKSSFGRFLFIPETFRCQLEPAQRFRRGATRRFEVRLSQYRRELVEPAAMFARRCNHLFSPVNQLTDFIAYWHHPTNEAHSYTRPVFAAFLLGSAVLDSGMSVASAWFFSLSRFFNGFVTGEANWFQLSVRTLQVRAGNTTAEFQGPIYDIVLFVFICIHQ